MQYLSTVAAALAKAGKTLEMDDDAQAVMLTEGYSPAYAARFLKRVIDERAADQRALARRSAFPCEA